MSNQELQQEIANNQIDFTEFDAETEELIRLLDIISNDVKNMKSEGVQLDDLSDMSLEDMFTLVEEM